MPLPYGRFIYDAMLHIGTITTASSLLFAKGVTYIRIAEANAFRLVTDTNTTYVDCVNALKPFVSKDSSFRVAEVHR